jgi:chromosome segregation ATPase
LLSSSCPPRRLIELHFYSKELDEEGAQAAELEETNKQMKARLVELRESMDPIEDELETAKLEKGKLQARVVCFYR